MMPAGDDDPERGGDDILAAEYVLGVLPMDERQAAAARIEDDPAFARLAAAWEERLSPLDAGYEEIEPPASAKAGLDARLFAPGGQPAAPARSGFMHSLAFWRGVAAAAVAALLLVVALPVLRPSAPPAGRLVASLTGEESGVRYLAVYDAAAGEIGLSHVAGDHGAGSDFELWAIEGDRPPVSLGVIPAGASVRLAVVPAHRAMIASGVLFAISLEPEGGSPTGQPTGPVVAAGDLRTV